MNNLDSLCTELKEVQYKVYLVGARVCLNCMLLLGKGIWRLSQGCRKQAENGQGICMQRIQQTYRPTFYSSLEMLSSNFSFRQAATSVF